MKKNVLVIARHDKVEALRMAAGLTLLDDAVSVAVVGTLEDTAAAREQVEVLEFAEVPIRRYGDKGFADPVLAREIIAADAVYLV